MSRRSRRTSRIRAVTGMLNAQANLASTRTRQAQIDLDDKRFDDAVAQRDRFVPVLAQASAAHEVKVFEYARILGARNSHPQKGPHQ